MNFLHIVTNKIHLFLKASYDLLLGILLISRLPGLLSQIMEKLISLGSFKIFHFPLLCQLFFSKLLYSTLIIAFQVF